jgi:hypothetical protein
MRDSDTYLAILDEGHEEHAKAVILRLGQKKRGPADDSIKARLSAFTDLARLDRIEDRLLDTASWQDLLDTP